MQNQELLTFNEDKATAGLLSQGATITADLGRDQLFTKNGKRFAKIFLISAAENLKKWQVDAASIPRRIGTFVGRPYISEPGLAHFDTDKIPVEETLRKQEQYRAGTIREVVTNKQTGISYAIVEMASNALGNKVWKEMQEGKAIYSSPAVAGISRDIGGTRHFIDWFGLHLARVSDPAYGVFHASIKETCEGDERSCVSKMVATASNFMLEKNNSHILKEFKPCQMTTGTAQNLSEECPPGPDGEDCRSKKVEQLSASVASLTAKLEKALANIPGSEGKTTPVTDPIGGEKQKSTGNDDCPPGPEGDDCRAAKQSQAPASANCPDEEKDADGNCPGSTASKDPQVRELQSIVAGYQQKEKQGLIDQAIEMASAAELITPQTADAEREKLSKLSIPELQTKVADLGPVVDKVAELQSLSGRIQGNESKIIRMPPTGTASMSNPSIPSSLSDIKGKWY